MSKDNGRPAFPTSWPFDKDVNHDEGMTLRDYFAAKAMQGLIADGALQHNPGVRVVSLAELAYKQADAMLAERGK